MTPLRFPNTIGSIGKAPSFACRLQTVAKFHLCVRGQTCERRAPVNSGCWCSRLGWARVPQEQKELVQMRNAPMCGACLSRRPGCAYSWYKSRAASHVCCKQRAACLGREVCCDETKNESAVAGEANEWTLRQLIKAGGVAGRGLGILAMSVLAMVEWTASIVRGLVCLQGCVRWRRSCGQGCARVMLMSCAR